MKIKKRMSCSAVDTSADTVTLLAVTGSLSTPGNPVSQVVVSTNSVDPSDVFWKVGKEYNVVIERM